MSDALAGLRAAIVGGSIGGLAAGVALSAIGVDAHVYERSPGDMESRGAGIVVQGELLFLLGRVAARTLPTTGCSVRRNIGPAGGDGETMAMPQRFTSWEAIHRTLRTAFPARRYHAGVDVSMGDAPDVAIGPDGTPLPADLVVWADGSRSAARSRLLPGVEPTYAGYVAWRGTVDEAALPARLVRFFDDAFTFCMLPTGGHALCYLIPGDAAATQPGQRRLNWVWYADVPEADLAALMTDREGRLRLGSVPPDLVPSTQAEALRVSATRLLHPAFAELVEATPAPFLQSILDVRVPRMAFGRSVLLGDAAFVVRPHTAGATAKAASDAWNLATAIRMVPHDLTTALRNYESRQLEFGGGMAAYGVALGRRWASAR